MSTALLLSGGMDSTALAYWYRPDLALTIDYGQLPAAGEIAASRAITEALKIPHHTLSIDCRSLGSGDMSGQAALPIAPVPEWWPYRNQLLVTLSATYTIQFGVNRLLIGSVASDGVHADGRLEFYETLNQLLELQEGAMRLEAPALNLTTVSLIRQANVPRDILGWAHSCHVSDFACGACRGCLKHYHVTKELYGEGY